MRLRVFYYYMKRRKNSAGYIQIFTTTPSKEEAERIAHSLVHKKLAACVQVVGPIESTYRWKGKIERAREWLCIIKTKRSLYSAVEKQIRALHSYTVPEILAMPVVAGNRKYLTWLNEVVVE